MTFAVSLYEIFHCKCSQTQIPQQTAKLQMAASAVLLTLGSSDICHPYTELAHFIWHHWCSSHHDRHDIDITIVSVYFVLSTNQMKPLNNPRSRHNEKSQSMFTAFSCSKTMKKQSSFVRKTIEIGRHTQEFCPLHIPHLDFVLVSQKRQKV